jgi:PKD repeat protein
MHDSPAATPVRVWCGPWQLRVLTMAVAVAAIALASGSAAAAGNGLRDLDVTLAGVSVAPSAEQLALVKELGNVEIGWTELGTPHSLHARSGTLTGSSSAAPDEIAREFVRSRADLFRQQPGDVANLELTMNHRDAQSGATFLRYRQLNDGLEVQGASLLVVLDRLGRITFVGGNLAPSMGEVAAPALTAGEAVAKAALNVSPQHLPTLHRVTGDAEQATFANTLALPALRKADPVEAQLVTVPGANGGRAAWRIEAEVASNADYEVLVDATTGEILSRQNQVSSTEPHGLVHTGDDPEAGGQVAGVLFSGIDGTWVAGTTTAGNNVNAYQDLPEDDTVAAADQPNAADQHFDYPWTDPWGTTGVLPAAGVERDAVVTQLFYYTNWYHDYAYNLGFTETARNFQENNFGRGGTGSDSVLAESDDGYGDATGTQMLCLDASNNPILCRNNANFNTNGADGNNPRMQMYVGEQVVGMVTRRTQRANNRDTVIHEYTHGITGRIISNTNLQGGVQSSALGEGWGDAYATSINDDPVYGEYNNADYTNGIRGLAYDDDSIEYGDLCSWTGGCEEHNDGRIWAMAMWEERVALQAKFGNAAGKAMHERLMMLGILATPDTPSFHDARTAYLGADVTFPGPDSQCLIWRVFADNELGVTAAPDADNDTTPTVSTTTPAACDPEAKITSPASTPEGSAAQLDASTSVVHGDSGDTLTYAWDLDDDGAYDDSTLVNPTVTFGDNGSYDVSVQVTNTAGYTDTADATLTITNVAPTVTIDASQLKNVDEGTALPILANFSDPGWLDTYPTASADPGTTYLASVAGTVAVTTQGPPQDIGTVQATITYGDNGSFTVTVSLTDDDGGTGSDAFVVVVANVKPTAVIDTTGATVINGVPTFMGVSGSPMSFTGNSTDPGSDDLLLRWLWDDGTPDTVTSSLVNGPATDPPLSPTVQPRAVTNTKSHTFGLACMFEITFRSTDDDGGTAFQNAAVLVVGNAKKNRLNGYWQHQYRGVGAIDYTPAQLDCFLEIAAYVSNVFNEVRNASTRPLAYDVLFMKQNGGTAREQFDRDLLTALVNFAAGSLPYSQLAPVLGPAEAVRLNPASTDAQLHAQRKLLEKLSQ